MKYFFATTFAVFKILTSFSQVNNYSLPFIPIFIDEFDKGKVDTTLWQDSRFYKSHMRFWPTGIREQQYYIKFDDPLQNPSENYVFEFDNTIGKEILSLAATQNPITAKAVDWMDPNQIIPEDNLGLTNYRTFSFRSGELNSRMRFKFGMYAIRFKMPKGCGFWPAFWLYSGTHSDNSCININQNPNFQPPSYCAGDEIDFFEWESENPTLIPANLHYDHQPSSALQYDIQTNQDLSDDYHMLFIEWQPSDHDNDDIIDDGFINWYFDPHLNPTNYPLYPNYHTSHKYDYAMGLLVNNAVGGPPYADYDDNSDYLQNCINGGFSSAGAAQFPAKFSIDYISVFYRFNCESTENICNWNPAIDQSAYTGGVINVSGNNCSVVVPGYEYDQFNNVSDGRDLKLIAAERIVLKPGFHAKKGSRVSAVIRNDCPRSVNDNMIISDTGSISMTQYFQKISENKIQVSQKFSDKNVSEFNENYLKIYPNPSSGIFQIKYSILCSDNKKIINIFDNCGRQIKTITNDINSIDLTEFSNGIYFIEVITKEFIIREKIIKQ